jgi:hypothetical protein
MGIEFEMPQQNTGGMNKEDYEHLEAGIYAARCIMMVELGTFKNDHPQAPVGATKKEIMVTFEVSDPLMKDGRPFTVSMRETLSMNKQANLYKRLISWKPWLEDFFSGKDHQDKTFKLADCLDQVCMVTVNYKNGWNNVTGVVQLPNGMPVIDRVNPLIEFDLSMINLPVFEELWPYVQNFIKASEEGVRFFGPNAPKTPPKEQPAQEPAENAPVGSEKELPY